MMDVDLRELLSLSVSPLELIVRGSVVYWCLFLLLRFVLRRDGSSVGVGDVLFIVLLGDASQNSMIGKGETIADGALLIAVLAFWNVAADYAAFRFPWARPLLQPRRMPLYVDGRKNRRNMRRELISDDELDESVRLHGLESLSDVQAIYMEAGGEISVIKKKKSK